MVAIVALYSMNNVDFGKTYCTTASDVISIVNLGRCDLQAKLFIASNVVRL